MKIIHLSDLHLGKKVLNFSMLEDQKDILVQIETVIDEEKPDAVVIAGDVYDKAVPMAEAVHIFDDFLVWLSSRRIETFVISGNHDSPERISFASRLIDATGIHMAPIYNGEVKPYVCNDEFGEVCFYLLPFIKPIQVRHFLEDDTIKTYTDAVSESVKRMNVDTAKRNVLVSHQFVTGAATCDSEISVGGIDNVDAGAYAPFDYVALGHIHGPQNIIPDRIRYSGTPLKYSFSEKNHHKSVTIVELGKKGDVKVSTRELKPLHDFITIEGTYDEIASKYRGLDLQDYVEVVLKDEVEIADAFRKLKGIFANIMQMRYDNVRTRESRAVTVSENVKTISEMELINRFYEFQNNQPMTDAQKEYMDKVITVAQEGIL